MNPTLDTLFRRKSTRAYSEQPLTLDEKDLILRAAFRAPTAGNLMLYSIIEVADQALKDRLVETCDNQPFIARAPLVLLFLADYQRWMDVFAVGGVEERCRVVEQPFRTPQEGDLMLACCDALIAAQNAVIAAESLGIGSCYIGDIMENCETHQAMFHLPRYVFPITLVCFGRPVVAHTTGPLTRRFYADYAVHKNTYQRMDPETIRQMMQPVDERFSTTQGGSSLAENAAQNTFFRKFNAEFTLEMNRSVREWLRNWRAGEE